MLVTLIVLLIVVGVLKAIREMYRTPSFIEVQLSNAPLLYEYEGQDG